MESRFQWQGKRQDTGAGAVPHACSDCKGLRDGTRSDQDPHEYLLCVSHSDASPQTEIYRCLVCESTLTRGRSGTMWAWT